MKNNTSSINILQKIKCLFGIHLYVKDKYQFQSLNNDYETFDVTRRCTCCNKISIKQEKFK